MRWPARFDRRLLHWLARGLFAPRTASAPGPEGPRRLAVVRLDERVGNLVTLQSLIDALRFQRPATEIGLLASTRSQPVARSLEGIDRLHLLDKRWFFRAPRAWCRVVAEVRARGYQAAIDASAWHEFSFTHAALTYYTGAPMRIGYARQPEAGFHTHAVPPGPADEHELAQRMRLLEPLGIVGDPPVLRTCMGESQAGRWAGWLMERLPDRPRIGVYGGSRKLKRRWPERCFILLAKQLQRRLGADLVLLWGPGEETMRDRLARALGRASIAPATNLEDLAGLMRGLDLVVTNDTGPMHLSVALGVSTLVLFVSGEPSRWGHPYAHVRNLRAAGGEDSQVEEALRACEELLA